MTDSGLLPVIALGLASVIGREPLPEAKEYTAAEQLLDGMPSDRYPKSGPAAAPERKAANRWLTGMALPSSPGGVGAHPGRRHPLGAL
jgi:hypothetical protein